MKKSLFASVLFAVAVVVAPAGVQAATSVTVSSTGPGSVVKVKVPSAKGSSKLKVTNNNTLSVSQATVQTAATGKAKVKKYTTAGNAATGNAENQSDVLADVLIENTPPASDCGCGNGDVTVSVDDTGPDSKVVVIAGGNGGNGTKITNNNIVSVTNTTSQTAVSGNASVVKNTNGGSATTGDASNTSTTDLTFTISN